MQCIHEMTIICRMNRPIQEFLATCVSLRQKAAEINQSVVDYMAGCFLPVSAEHEKEEHWLVRQVEEILETELMHDEISSHPKQNAAHFRQRTRSIKMNDEDRRYLLETFGTHPDVVACRNRIAAAHAA